jgi:hypothetical protein
MANMINEKVFIAVWWWLWIVVVLGTLSILRWMRFLFWGHLSSNYIFNAVVQGDGANMKYLNKAMNVSVYN